MLLLQTLTTPRSRWMDEIQVINILKWYGDKKTEKVIKSQAFLFSAAI